jgi:dipeptidyl aminopeptidase/acylaminoacyl peptidase
MKTIFILFAAIIGSTSFAQNKVDLAPYLNLRGAGTPSISPDGKWIFYTSSVSGTAQLWKLPAKATPDGDCYWPEQVTFFSDPVSAVQVSPDGKQIIFRKDNNGDERSQLYLIPFAGGALDTLTKNPKAIFNGHFSSDGKYIYFTSNERNEAFTDAYRLDVRTRKVEMLHESHDQDFFMAISPDHRWLFIERTLGAENARLYVKDLNTQKAADEPKLLTQYDGTAGYFIRHVSNDSKRIYLTTNQGKDIEYRAYIDFQNAKPKVVPIEEGKWEIDQDYISENEDIEIVTRNVEGASEMTIYDFKTQKVLPSPKMPEQGFINNLQISLDANIIAFNFTSPKEIGSIYVFDRKRNVTEPITKPNFSGLDPKSFVTCKLVRYPSAGGAKIPALYYEGKNPSGKQMPVICFMHGGPEGQERPWFNSIAQYFVARGYNVLIPNVRGSTGYGKEYSLADNGTKRMTSVNDMRYAGYWLSKQPGVDSNKRIIYGGSYGGFMSLAAMTMQPEIWAAGIDLFGIANFHSFLKNTGAWRQKNRIAEYGDPVKDSAFLVEVSPLTHVDNIRKPLFVYQGKNDPRVPPGESEQIVEAVKKKGIPVEYILLPDEGHGISKRENRIKVYTQMIDFLDRVLAQ